MATSTLIEVNRNVDRIHSSTEIRYDGKSFAVYARKFIPRNTVIMISPIILSIRSTDPKFTTSIDQDYYRSSGWIHSLVSTIQQNGLLIRGSPNFSESLLEVFLSLHPRSDSLEYSTIPPSEKELFAKLHRNGIAGDKYPFKLMKYGNLINNSCVPNAFVKSTPDELFITIFSIRDISPNEEVTIGYNHIWPVDDIASRKKIWSEYGFSCQCVSCCKGIVPSTLMVAIHPSLLNSTHCWFCGNTFVKKCSRCQIAAYCDSRCQTENWGIHRKICNILKNQSENMQALQEPHEDQLEERPSIRDLIKST